MPDTNPIRRRDVVFSRSVSFHVRADALRRFTFNCHMCGLAPGETDATTGRRARVHVRHIVERRAGGKDELSNLLASCSICLDGRRQMETVATSENWLLSQVRRAGIDEQRAVLNWLQTKFKE